MIRSSQVLAVTKVRFLHWLVSQQRILAFSIQGSSGGFVLEGTSRVRLVLQVSLDLRVNSASTIIAR